MNEQNTELPMQSPLPVHRERARVRAEPLDVSGTLTLTPTLSRRTRRGSELALAAASTFVWTVAGVGVLILLGKAIGSIGTAAGLPSACWQLTGARAAASTAVLGGLVSLRRGNLLLFGALYGLWLMAGHASILLAGSAVIAGAAAWLLGLAFADRGLIVRLLATTLAFNVLLTMSGLVKAIAGDAASRVTLGSWAGGAGMRVLATVVVVGAFALITTARPREDVVR